MEHAQRAQQQPAPQQAPQAVLILILMEHAQRGINLDNFKT